MQTDRSGISGTESPRRPRRPILLLALVLAVAFGVRLWTALETPSYFDDHYVFNNIDTFLNGSLRPRQSYYGSLSYLPQALVLAVMQFLHSRTGIAALAVRGGYYEGFTTGAFLIMRMFVVAYALVSLVMTYLVGRRLFSPAVGLAAAAVLAAYPQHVRSAIQLKPDMMALMFTMITLYWTVEAAKSPRLASYLRSGVGVGLTTAAKYIGVGAAIPLTVWSLWAGLRDRRVWGWLVLAGVASVVAFIATNPYFTTVLHFGNRLIWFYGRRARSEQSSHLVVARGELDFLIAQHGWFLGTCFLAGLILLIAGLRSGRESREAVVLPLSLALGYPLAYGVGMSLFRTHNLLPALGGTALVCGYALVRAGEWLLARRGARMPAAVRLAGVAVALFLLIRPIAYAYSRLVPDTWEVAGDLLREGLEPAPVRHLAYEPAKIRFWLGPGWQRPAMTAVPSLAALPPAGLDLTDAEAFPLARTEGPQGDFYRRRRQGMGQACAVEVRARAFRAQGEPVLLLLHPWTPAGGPLDLPVRRAGPEMLSASLPDSFAAGDVLSFELIRPAAEDPPAEELRLGGERLPLMPAGGRPQKVRFLTPRFRYAAGETEVLIPASALAHPRTFRLQLRRWSPAACESQGSTPP